ncbi:Acyltransferase [Vibrio owensii]|uniref:acyltransferase family protein n=1 Tax=Vibrio owensii TaxID=696485 RepID=UPI002894FD4B|nr:Acyltransferase [Vibrio owensii]CAH1554840.1 Acyltransferase [Vibrio owensii]
MSFRYDINGLRAIAVIAVVLFHFNPNWIPGGFAGVDVFFVISGFLMTKIIFGGLENDSFSLFKFYLARANRIIPALAVVCLVLLLFGWFYLTPLDYRALGKHVASSMTFLSNVIYWKEAGYFDAASHEKWLLHTWSLSVEWQFYIIYPIVLVLSNRYLSLEGLKRLIVVGTLLSFTFSVIATIRWPEPAYYILPTRAWEMMIGGMAFLYPWKVSDDKKRAIVVTGLFLILISYIFFSNVTPWPGYFSALPVLGTYLVIIANQQSNVITKNSVLQHLGRWSYSIYLWHWPIVVIGYYFDISNWFLYGLPLSIVMGFFSFKFVESFRFKLCYKWFDILKVKAVYMVLFLSFIGSYIFVSQGVTRRVSDELGKNAILASKPSLLRSLGGCFIADDSDDWEAKKDGCVVKNGKLITNEPYPDLILIGDSHADTIVAAVSKAFEDKKVLVLSFGGCLFSRDTYIQGKDRDNCLPYMEYNFSRLLNQYSKIPILISQRYSLYFQGDNKAQNSSGKHFITTVNKRKEVSDLNEENTKLAAHYINEVSELAIDRDVYILGPIPEMKFDIPKKILKNMFLGDNVSDGTYITKEDYNERNKVVMGMLRTLNKQDSVTLLDVTDLFFHEQRFYGFSGVDVLYRDHDHLSFLGGDKLTGILNSKIKLL